MELKAVAVRCRVSQRTIERWIATGEIIETRETPAGSTVVRRASVESWLRRPVPLALMRTGRDVSRDSS